MPLSTSELSVVVSCVKSLYFEVAMVKWNNKDTVQAAVIVH